jgi:hypothetical protein
MAHEFPMTKKRIIAILIRIGAARPDERSALMDVLEPLLGEIS